jgi:glycosyltransferase involved in cell wall biosynthesis
MRGDILLLSRYDRLGASSRVRSYQYLASLRAAGLTVAVHPLFSDAVVRSRHADGGLPFRDVVRGYIDRGREMLRARGTPLVWIEYELLPWLPYALEGWLYKSGCAIVVDYDDAIFHRYAESGNRLVRFALRRKIDRIMEAATLVIAGNKYLADHASGAGAKRVEILPSVIDLKRYRQKADFGAGTFTIGWIGSPSTTPYLRTLEPVLDGLRDLPGLRVVNVGGTPWHLDRVVVENRDWSEDSEVDAMLDFDVGVMPLPDVGWARGKCGYKLIQYMGCGLPTVASPVGANASIVEPERTGFLASTADEWMAALRRLAASPTLRDAMGRAGHERISRDYDLAVTAPRLVRWFEELVRESPRNAKRGVRSARNAA